MLSTKLCSHIRQTTSKIHPFIYPEYIFIHSRTDLSQLQILCPLTRTNVPHPTPHTYIDKTKHWWYVYYFTRFHRVMCTEVQVSCMLYATESSSCSNSGDIWSAVFGILKSASVQFTGKKRFLCKRRCRGSGSYACPLQTVPEQFLIFVSHNQLQCAHLITSHDNRVNLSANVLLKNKRKTALYKKNHTDTTSWTASSTW